MKRSLFSLEIFGDRLSDPKYFSGETNSRQIALMKKALGKAIKTELTDRQREMLNEYYFKGVTVTGIAEKYNIDKSTVSRHLTRSRERLKDALKYGFYTLWDDE